MPRKDPTEEEMKTRQGCAQAFFESLGCAWIALGCFAIFLLPIGLN